MTNRFIVTCGLLMTSLSIWCSAQALVLTNGGAFMPYAVFRALPLGTVLPDGWLKGLLVKEANGFTGHQPEFCYPFNEKYWAGQEIGQDNLYPGGGRFWYSWEQSAYWIVGAYRCGKLIDDARLMQRAMTPITYTMANPKDGWFLGPQKLLDQQNSEPGRWPDCIFFRALMACSEGTNDPSILAAMQKHYLSDASTYQVGPFGTDDIQRDRTAIESILYCYGRTGNVNMLNKAKAVWAGVSQASIKHLTADRRLSEHGVSYAEASKLGAILYLYTGDTNYLYVSTRMLDNVFKYHMLVSGTPSTAESFNETAEINGHEVCDIYEFNRSMGYLLMATGNGDYADRIERALFNAGMGAVRKDWSGCQYFSYPNQAVISRTSNMSPGYEGVAAMAYGPNADHRAGTNGANSAVTSCCHGNVANLVPDYAERMWMDDRKGGLAAVLYGPCHVVAPAGVAGTMVGISEETDYPFSEHITFTVSTPAPVTFPLYLRIPAWCAAPSLTVNGASVAIPPLHSGFVAVRRTFRNADKVVLFLPMPLNKSMWPNDAIAIERGPVVYSVKLAEAWQSYVGLTNTTSTAFPMWTATTTSHWNYALVIRTNVPLDKQVQINTGAAGGDPWSRPPISLTMQARQVTNWTFQSYKGGGSYTPRIPSSQTLSTNMEQIVLVPYGATCLRMTVLPWVAGR